MASFNIELNSKPVRNTNEHTLLLRITVDRKPARIKMNYAIPKKDFNPNPKEYKYVRASHPKHKVINDHIDAKIQQPKDAITELEKEHATVTANTIKSKMLAPTAKSFLEYAKQVANSLLVNNHYGNYNKYNTIINKLTDYRKGEDLHFDQITPSFLSSFEASLLKLGNCVNTVNCNIRTLRAIYYKGIENGYIDPGKNPFFTFKLKQSRPNKDRLNQEEITTIEGLVYPKDSLLWNVHNVFLFSFYCAGIRISDILQLKWNNVQDGRLVYTMYKTNKAHSVKLKEKPLAILEKYKDSGKSFIFPFFSDRFDYSDLLYLHNQIGAKTALINKYLKKVAEKAEITKKITTHTARHSFADLARQKTDNIYNLSKTLGHSSIKVTEAYLASFDQQAVDDTMDSMFDEPKNKVPDSVNDKRIE
ncbi:MAG: site-specific integrase [Bacteroidales bacterium]|nr:site-specific integrase [Bacteroidales bacterium]